MKKMRNKIDGVLLFDKPLGISSNNAIQKVKYALNAEKVGHTGTLDPMATGLLPICLGEATKFANFLLDGDKEYIATAQLGLVTDSGDSEGNIIAKKIVDVSLDDINRAIIKFTGGITQVPPMYSALKFNGKPLYEYAREGIIIERPSRDVVIHQLEFISYDSIEHQLTFRAKVSKGTYIRTLAEDIGNYLGCGASLIGLRRIATNEFCIDQAYSLENINAVSSYVDLNILPIDVLCASLPIINVDDSLYKFLKNGNQCTSFEPLDITTARLYYREKFIGIAEIVLKNNQTIIAPKRMLSNLS